MIEEPLNQNELAALRAIRNAIMHKGKSPTVRDLADELKYRSPRSAMLLIDQLIDRGFIDRRGRELRIVRLPAELKGTGNTTPVPLVGTVACGAPLFAEENVECMVPVATSIARPGHRYFLLRVHGDSMDNAGIEPGDLILVRQQNTAESGDRVVALIDDAATVKELQVKPGVIALMPRSKSPKHKPILVDRDFQIQGKVVEVLKGAAELLE